MFARAPVAAQIACSCSNGTVCPQASPDLCSPAASRRSAIGAIARACSRFYGDIRLVHGHRQTQTCSSARYRRITRRSSVLGSGAILLSAVVGRPVAMAAEKEDKPQEGDQPEDFRYTHLWTSQDGETHLKECSMKGFDLKSFAGDTPPQFVKEGPQPTKVTFSELPSSNEQDWHPCPGVQFVVCLGGSWCVETTDGGRKDFSVGEVLFQDDCKASPADKTPQHKSGVNGNQPNQQMILSVERKPEVDRPGSLDEN